MPGTGRRAVHEIDLCASADFTATSLRKSSTTVMLRKAHLAERSTPLTACAPAFAAISAAISAANSAAASWARLRPWPAPQLWAAASGPPYGSGRLLVLVGFGCVWIYSLASRVSGLGPKSVKSG